MPDWHRRIPTPSATASATSSTACGRDGVKGQGARKADTAAGHFLGRMAVGGGANRSYPVDLILVDDIHRRPVGRPWITLAMDVFSRMVVGFYVSFDPPGAMAVGLCLAHAILPKEGWLAKYEVATAWPVWGVMAVVHADNAKEFHGRMLRAARRTTASTCSGGRGSAPLWRPY